MKELESDFDRSYNPLLSLKTPRKRDPTNSLYSPFQCLAPLTVRVSSIFQLHSSFSFFDLILLDPTSGMIIPLLSFQEIILSKFLLSQE